jgi:hypothetical protein
MGNSATLSLFAALLGVSTFHHYHWPISGPKKNNIFLFVLLFSAWPKINKLMI